MIPVIVNSIIFLNPVTQPILQILNGQLSLVLPFTRTREIVTLNLPRRNQDMVKNMHRAITSKRIRKRHPAEPIQLNRTKRPKAGNINRQTRALLLLLLITITMIMIITTLHLQQGRQIKMRKPPGTQVPNLAVGCIKRVRVERLVLDDVVLQQSAEVFHPVAGEKEGVDSQTQVLEGFVGGCEDGDALLGVFERRREAGF